MARTPTEWCEKILGSTINRIAVEETDDGPMIIIGLNNGQLTFEGEPLELSIELNEDRYQS